MIWGAQVLPLLFTRESSQAVAFQHPQHEELEEHEGDDRELVKVENEDIHNSNIGDQRALAHKNPPILHEQQ